MSATNTKRREIRMVFFLFKLSIAILIRREDTPLIYIAHFHIIYLVYVYVQCVPNLRRITRISKTARDAKSVKAEEGWVCSINIILLMFLFFEKTYILLGICKKGSIRFCLKWDISITTKDMIKRQRNGFRLFPPE